MNYNELLDIFFSKGECLSDATTTFLTFTGFKREFAISSPLSFECTLQLTVVGYKYVTRRYLEQFCCQKRA